MPLRNFCLIIKKTQFGGKHNDALVSRAKNSEKGRKGKEGGGRRRTTRRSVSKAARQQQGSTAAEETSTAATSAASVQSSLNG